MLQVGTLPRWILPLGSTGSFVAVYTPSTLLQSFEGDPLGISDGMTLGELDGLSDGDADGSDEGCALGSSDGEALGVLDG